MFENKLNLLALSQNFIIRKFDSYYIIEHITENIQAEIYKDKTIKYYVNGCYDSGSDEVEFNMNAMLELKSFCELMIKE